MTLHVPLVVRLQTPGLDRHVTRDVRDLSFRSDIPGGFSSCHIALDRPLSLDPVEIQLYADLYVYDGRSGETVWQGRMEDPGRGAGEQGQVWDIVAVGPSAHAKDQTVPLIYIDKNLQFWLRSEATNATSHPSGQIADAESVVDQSPAVQMFIPRGTVCNVGFLVAMMYRGLEQTGQKLARVDYRWDAGITSTNWLVRAVTRNGYGDTTGTVVRSQTMTTSGSSADPKVIGTDWTAGETHVDLREERITSQATIADDDHWLRFAGIVIMATRYDKSGNELLTGASYTANTVLASDVVADLLGRLLDQYDGANANIETSTYAIDHLAYPDGATSALILDDLMQFESDMFWAAWEGDPARFEFVSWPTAIAYDASAKDGFESPGSAADIFNEVNVRYRRSDGLITSTVRTQTVAALDDAGLTRKAIIDLGDEIGSSANADQIGDEFLSQHALPPNAGTLTVRTPIFDADLGRTVQPWEIRPGKLIRVRDVLPRVDALNATARDAVTVFRVVGVEYNAGDNTATLDLDSRPRTLRNITADAAELTAAGKRRR